LPSWEEAGWLQARRSPIPDQRSDPAAPFVGTKRKDGYRDLSTVVPGAPVVPTTSIKEEDDGMASREHLDRRKLGKMAGGMAAAASLGIPMRASAQDDAAATEAANATATAEAEGVQVTTEEEGKINVSWWTHNNVAFVDANTAMITAFEEANPDIHIVYQYFPYDVFVQKLQTGYSSDTVADIQQMFGTWVTQYARFGLLDPVPEEMAASMADRFWPAASGAYEIDGVFYGQPKEYNLENGGLLVNPALIEEAGATETPTEWQAMVDLAVTATKRDSNDLITQSGLAFIATDTVVFTFLSMILQQGASYFAEDGVHVDLQTDAAKQAWQDLTALSTEHRVDDSQSYSPETQEFFFQGSAAMCARGPWVISVGQEQFPDLEFRYDPIPPYVGDEMLFAAESGWGEVVNAAIDDEKKAAAWKFIDFMHQDDNLRQWNLATTTVPSLQSLLDDPALLDATPGLATSFAALPGGQWIGQIGDRDRFFDALFNAFISVDIGEASAEEALGQAEQEINAMIDENLGP
jgi:multiple sugar transport system substrate-binding protein